MNPCIRPLFRAGNMNNSQIVKFQSLQDYGTYNVCEWFLNGYSFDIL